MIGINKTKFSGKGTSRSKNNILLRFSFIHKGSKGVILFMIDQLILSAGALGVKFMLINFIRSEGLGILSSVKEGFIIICPSTTTGGIFNTPWIGFICCYDVNLYVVVPSTY